MKTFISDVSGENFPENEKVDLKTISNKFLNYIQIKHPAITEKSCFSRNELHEFRENYISEYLTEQLGELTETEKEVVNSIVQHTTLAGKLDDDEEEQTASFGDRLADKVADFGGSWRFIIIFGIILFAWIVLNAYFLKEKGFDPYPFILLNLILSCIAAIQAPVIMMSQNRQEDKDRDRAKKDYMINLKSELEIHTVHEKLDHLILHQQQELLEIQRIQLNLLQEIQNKLNKNID